MERLGHKALSQTVSSSKKQLLWEGVVSEFSQTMTQCLNLQLGGVNKICQIVVLVFPVLLSFCCTLHGIQAFSLMPHAGMREKAFRFTLIETQHMLSVILWWKQDCETSNNLSLPLKHSLSMPSPQLLSGFVTSIGLHRKPAGPATIQTCSVPPWEHWGQPQLSAHWEHRELWL